MNNLLKSCHHNKKIFCNHCDISETKCTLKPILADANIILSKYLEETNTQKAIDFLNKNRYSHRVIVTSLVLGEVMKIIVESNDERLDAEFGNIANDLRHFEYRDVNYSDDEFLEIFSIICGLDLHCGERDKVHIASAIHLKIELASFDKGMNKTDAEKINKALKDIDYKFKLYNLD